jgi:predicted methyltransferase
MGIIKNGLEISHKLINKIVKEGDIVIDATAGNGNDTVFLAEIVGEKGKVYSFDIQETALKNTKKKLKKLNLLERVELIHDGHENIDKYITSKVNAVMFNLGYLPGGDHKIQTRAETTITAVEKSLNILVEYGIIVLVIYHGGDSGFKEKEAVIKYLKALDSNKYVVLLFNHINQANYPPIAVCIEKLQ